MDLAHELTWSVSRMGTFGECRRRYYYDYYLSWNGWRRDAEPERQATYLLKKMTRMPMWAGTVLHSAIEHWLGLHLRGTNWSEEQLVEYALGQFRKGYKESRDGTWRQRPSRMTRLAEHHYTEDCIEEASGAAAAYGSRYVERIQASLREFFAAPDLERVRSIRPQDVLAIEKMATFDLAGTRVFAIPDVALRVPAETQQGEQVWIYDWKSGGPREGDSFQLATYAAYACRTWDAEPQDVQCVDVYLARGERAQVNFTEAELEQSAGRIEASLAEMAQLHFDAGLDQGDPEAFPMVAASAGACATCNYRELCDRVVG